MNEAQTILVTGGAGYIGSHTVLELLNEGHTVIVVDNLCNSSMESLVRVEELTDKNVTYYNVDVRDSLGLRQVFSQHQIDEMMDPSGNRSRRICFRNNQINDYFDHRELVLIEKDGCRVLCRSSCCSTRQRAQLGQSDGTANQRCRALKHFSARQQGRFVIHTGYPFGCQINTDVVSC